MMFIQTEATPNPATLKFLPGQTVVEEGSYLRLKAVQLGYTLPNDITKKFFVSNLRFYIAGQNLLTFTDYTGTDPEIGAISSFDIGIDRAVYPQSRTFRIGTNITF